MTDLEHKEHAADHGPNFQTYIAVFIALCVGTGLSFLANLFLGQGAASFWIIMAVAVFKATLVAMIFMHLKFDWGRLYCIVIPVSVMAVMMMIVLLPDSVFYWHHLHRQQETAAESTGH
ncbi:MAG: cytochrome C oxidase subunit IV family protein [Planctomycetes bacterium]|nr:cytochrome C oxidase subunit IV family protein [Planctomycetota bacterium]